MLATTGSVHKQSSEVCTQEDALCEQLYDWTGNEGLSEAVAFLVGFPIKTTIIVVGALILNHLGRRWSARVAERVGQATEDHAGLVSDRNAERATERGETIGSLLKSLVTVVVFGIAGILILELLGIDIATAIMSAGVLAIAIGFGAQSVVADLFAGVFMLAEDQFSVGDRIDTGTVNGYVRRITLRTTVIRDSNGKVWHIPNSKIDFIANETQSWSRAVVIMGVSYSTDLDDAVRVLDEAATALTETDEWSERVVEPPSVQAVQELGEAVDIRVLVWVESEHRRALERALRLHCKLALDNAGIEIPNPGIDIFLRDGDTPAA
ncbi:MAG: mechanosensitive ion channel family protein [Acidimicrobiia bacterium]|nr:mechanosensitive ion channel family protein [Acidimicrobiia bacterium]